MSVTSLREKRSEQLAERLRLAEMTPLQRAQEAGYHLITPARMRGDSPGIGLTDSGMRLLQAGHRALGEPPAVHVLANAEGLAIVAAGDDAPTAFTVAGKARGIGGNALRDRLIADGWPLGQHAGWMDGDVLIVPKREQAP